MITPLSHYMTRRPQRMELLRHVAEQGSISKAAKAAGLSYKAAWDAIDELNNLAAQPLVERVVGGRGGGGAQLSAEGARVLALFQRLQALQAQLLDGPQEDFNLLRRLMLRTSARNQLQGTVSAMTHLGRDDLVHLDLGAGLQLCAQITHASTLSLELAVGSEVVALIKAGWLTLLPADATASPAAVNQLPGCIEHIEGGDGEQAEVRVSLANGQVLCALSAPPGTGVGSPVRVQVDPTQVLLGVSH